MYSVVILMAMGGSMDMPDFGRHRHGCCGGGYSSGCCGGSYYSGCCGGGYYGGYSSGCCGGGYTGWGGGYGTGCSGGHYVSSSYGSSPYYGSGYGAPVYYSSSPYYSDRPYQVYPRQSMYYEPSYFGPGVIDQRPRDDRRDGERPAGLGPDGKPLPLPPAPDKPREEAAGSAPATIVVSLPAEAKLTIDDRPTRSTSDQREFTTPLLPSGKEFHYTVKAQIVRDDKPVEVRQDVAVRAGETTRVTLTFPTNVSSK